MLVLYKILLRVRPAPLAVALKKALGVRRRVINDRRGIQFWLDPVSHFGMEILRTHQYEPSLSELIVSVLRPGDTFVDAGANEGYFSMLGAREVTGGRVIAIEPQTRLIPVIEENIRLNGEKTVSIFHVALSDRKGEVKLYLAPDTNTGASAFHRHWRFGGTVETVSTITLDELLDAEGAEKVRLLKIDCEGAELDILGGARHSLSRQRFEFISVDFHPGIVGNEVPRQIDRILREHGYGLSRTASGIWVYHLLGLESALDPLGPHEILPAF